MALGQNTPNGFLPGEPNIESIISKVMGGDSGWNSLLDKSSNPEIRKPADADLLNCYVQFYHSDFGKKILEDLLNMTLRTAPAAPEAMESIEKLALHVSERKGQNGIVVAILKRITDGHGQPNAAYSKKKKSRK